MHFQEKYLTIEDVNQKSGKRNIFFTEWGDKNNTCIVCIHGLTRNSRDFDYLAHELSSDFYIICPDMAGRGKSSWLDDRSFYNYLTYMGDIGILLGSLNIEKTHWIGTSMGGLIGMNIANVYPDFIGKMVINDVGPYLKQDSLNRIYEYIIKMPIYNSKNEAKEAIKKRMRSFGVQKEEHWDHFAEHMFFQNEKGEVTYAYDPAIINAFGDDPREFKDINLWHLWQKLEVPVLLIHGLESNVLTKDIVEEMKKYRDFSYFPVANVGHTPTLMNEIEIEKIKNYLKL